MRYVLKTERVWVKDRQRDPDADVEFDLPDGAQIVGFERDGDAYLLIKYVLPSEETEAKVLGAWLEEHWGKG